MSGPLTNLKVLDFSTLLPGPFATLYLADLGADVLRIESPTRPDLVRMIPPYDGDVSTAHAYLNRNKRSLALDLKQAESVAIVKRLAADYDIVVDQFRPGVMDRLGIGYEVLRNINPRLIYCAITGYGQTGPLKQRAGHDINYLALAGCASYTGRRESGPLPLGLQVADIAGGSLHAVIGILAAVLQRQATGLGQLVDIGMADCAFALNAMSGAAALAGGVDAGMEQTLLNGGSFYDYYQTADGRYLSVGSLEPQFMQALALAIGQPELGGLGLAQDKATQEKLKQNLRDTFMQKPLAYWQNVFAGIDACVEPVLSVSEAASQPQAKARNWVVQVPKPGGGSQAQMACPIKFSAAELEYRHTGGPVGEHGNQVLTELADARTTAATNGMQIAG